jgi:hypothetical protein
MAKKRSPNAEPIWFLADVVMHVTVEDDPRSEVHINSVLVQADTSEQAHAAAVKLGRDAESRYENESGKRVRFRFRGLTDLFRIEGRLEHGTEITAKYGLSEEQVRGLVTRKNRLAVFGHKPGRDPRSPDYMSARSARSLRAAGCDPQAVRGPEPTRRRGKSKT